LLAPDRPAAPRVIEHEPSFLAQSSVVPDEPFEVQEEIEYEEVTVEPDLPADPVPEPEELSQYQQMVAAMPSTEPVYLAGNRAPRLKVGDYTLEPGDIVPGAHDWPRREAYERLGRIEKR
jgi:hypothetical protein